MGDRGHNRHGPKRVGEAAVPLSRGRELGPRLTQCGLGWGLLPYEVASLSIQPFGHNRHGRKLGVPPGFGGEGAGSPSNTMWPGPMPTCMPSFILIHPTVWPSYTNVTGRTRQAGQTDRRRYDSVGRTVLQTVAQKWVI